MDYKTYSVFIWAGLLFLAEDFTDLYYEYVELIGNPTFEVRALNKDNARSQAESLKPTFA